MHISTEVQDASTEAPIRDALVMVLRPGVKPSSVDINRLDDQVLSWGQSNTAGEVLLKQPVPVPGKYTVMVVASGYEPLIGEDQLVLDANTPQRSIRGARSGCDRAERCAACSSVSRVCDRFV